MSAVQRASQILLVGQRIRQLRKSRHLTQADLASRIGITQSDLSRMESGEYKVGLDTLFKILHVFELSMSRFFEEAPEIEKQEGPNAEGEMPEREQLLADFAQLSDDSRREVREFIAFKRQQAERFERLESSEVAGNAEPRRPKWPSAPEAPEEAPEATGAPEDPDKNEDGEVS
ncbi:MAG TPA: helix-turn-helix transcriptional regulator [Thermoanaerobaculia bacterium]|nr:helix-turn-helix transcriptional regulator [Thermoanaerobaculia bacterium]